MLNIGCHLSASDGYSAMAKQAIEIGANTFQFFTRNPRGFKAKEIDETDIAKFLQIVKENNFVKILAHAPYTLNPCSADKRVRDLAKEIFIDDLKRMEYTPNNMYNFHPGSHVGQGVQAGIDIISDTLNDVITKEQTTIILLETMSGKGSEIGSKFEELKQIMDKVKFKNKIGVCLDTCHVYDGGYDIVNNLDGVIEQFDTISSHKDRHEKIGEGYLGIQAIEKIINHSKLKHLSFFLETPNEIDGYAKEIELLKNIYKD